MLWTFICALANIWDSGSLGGKSELETVVTVLLSLLALR